MGHPANTSKEYYIQTGNFNDRPLLEIIEEARAHFGEDTKLSELSIAPEHIKVSGCSCCFDYSDYETYLCVYLTKEV